MKTICKTISGMLLIAGAVLGNVEIGQAQTRKVQVKVVPQVHEHSRPQLGFYPVDQHCLEVAKVIYNSPAHRMGLERGDRILSVNGTRVYTPDDLANALEEAVHHNNGRVRILIDNVRARRGEPGASRHVYKTIYLESSRPSHWHDDDHHHHHHHHD